MSYYIARTVSTPFDATVADVKAKLKEQGFGVLTDIDVQSTPKSKIGADTPKYRILGACNPRLAHEALKIEERLGVLLPCNTPPARTQFRDYRVVTRSGRSWGMTAFPIPPHELKSSTWYYGVRCVCTRMHALCEDLFPGKGDEQDLQCAVPVEVPCECGAVTHADRLDKFKTP